MDALRLRSAHRSWRTIETSCHRGSLERITRRRETRTSGDESLDNDSGHNNSYEEGMQCAAGAAVRLTLPVLRMLMMIMGQACGRRMVCREAVVMGREESGVRVRKYQLGRHAAGELGDQDYAHRPKHQPTHSPKADHKSRFPV